MTTDDERWLADAAASEGIRVGMRVLGLGTIPAYLSKFRGMKGTVEAVRQNHVVVDFGIGTGPKRVIMSHHLAAVLDEPVDADAMSEVGGTE